MKEGQPKNTIANEQLGLGIASDAQYGVEYSVEPGGRKKEPETKKITLVPNSTDGLGLMTDAYEGPTA